MAETILPELTERFTCHYPVDDLHPRLLDLRELLGYGITHVRLSICPPKSRPSVQYVLLAARTPAQEVDRDQ